MKILAIKGHKTRGKEVIELLEMMGGNTFNSLMVNALPNRVYYIGNNNAITWTNIYSDNGCLETEDFFTLEEFLDKYPFKIGDRVLIPEYESEVRICKMRWDSLCEYVEYMVYRNDDPEWYTAEELLNYNDNPTQCLDTDCCINNTTKSLDDVYSITTCKTTGQGTYAIKIADGYKFDSIDENGNIIVKSIKSKYPKNYKECCNILDYHLEGITIIGYEKPLLENFQQLLICRDAYWKIAGEELGLGKPWEPDWTNNYQKKWLINFYQGEINFTNGPNVQFILAFPTVEMQNAFYESFKDLIEKCKELI